MSDVTDLEMATGVTPFNELDEQEARTRLMTCLGVPRWVDTVLSGRPYADLAALLAVAGEAACHLTDDELAAALAGHPRIGERATDPRHAAEFSRREQSRVDPADAAVAAELAAGNADYERRFDRVFLIRAAGRSPVTVTPRA